MGSRISIATDVGKFSRKKRAVGCIQMKTGEAIMERSAMTANVFC